MAYKDPEVGRARAAARYQANREAIRAAAKERWRSDADRRAQSKTYSAQWYRERRGAWSAEKRLERAARVAALTPPAFVPASGIPTHHVPLFGDHHSIVGFVRVDEDDLAAVSQYRWGRTYKGYVIRTDRSTGVKTTIIMHRELMGVPVGDPRQVDHINGDTMDCTRVNLRVVMGAHNAQNRKSHGPSPYRGVHKRSDGRRKPWVANVCIAGKQTTLGYFATEIEAAEVAREARRIHMPFSVERDLL